MATATAHYVLSEKAARGLLPGLVTYATFTYFANGFLESLRPWPRPYCHTQYKYLMVSSIRLAGALNSCGSHNWKQYRLSITLHLQ